MGIIWFPMRNGEGQSSLTVATGRLKNKESTVYVVGKLIVAVSNNRWLSFDDRSFFRKKL